MPQEISTKRLLEDNYSYFIKDKPTGKVAVVDPSATAPILEFLKTHNYKLDFILNTHHHWDHTGGNLELKEKTGAKVVASSYESDKIPAIDIALKDNELFQVGETKIHAWHLPGHTLGQIAFYIPEASALFTGDTMFAMGCGRLFVGTAEQLWTSFKRIRTLPSETKIYCGHDYALKNASFVQSVDPENPYIAKRLAHVQMQKSSGAETVPVLLKDEIHTNPFMRADDQDFKAKFLNSTATDVGMFAALRKRRDGF